MSHAASSGTLGATASMTARSTNQAFAPWSESIIRDLASVLCCLVRAKVGSPPRFASSCSIPAEFFSGEAIECVRVSGGPSLAEESGELVRVYFNTDDKTAMDELRRHLFPLLSPSVVGFGKTECRQTPDGFVILCANHGPNQCRHDFTPGVKLNEMLDRLPEDRRRRVESRAAQLIAKNR